MSSVAHTNCRAINVAGNYLTGTFPSNIGTITTLTYLDIGYNSFNGSLPASLFTITNLISVYTAWSRDARFTGTIPSTISNLRKLTYVAHRKK